MDSGSEKTWLRLLEVIKKSICSAWNAIGEISGKVQSILRFHYPVWWNIRIITLKNTKTG